VDTRQTHEAPCKYTTCTNRKKKETVAQHRKFAQGSFLSVDTVMVYMYVRFVAVRFFARLLARGGRGDKTYTKTEIIAENTCFANLCDVNWKGVPAETQVHQVRPYTNPSNNNPAMGICKRKSHELHMPPLS